MTKKDYIEKITQNLEHLTKDELKDVSILTTAQYGVRLKVAEKEYIEKEIANLTPQLQQQALPVVPECVGEWIEHCKGMGYSLIAALTFKLSSTMHEELSAKILKWLGNERNDETFALAFITGKYEVEKPQLFYLKHIDMSKQSRYCDCYLVKEDDGTLWHDDTINKNEKPGGGYKNSCYKFTQQEIDSMQTGSYEQIEVEE